MKNLVRNDVTCEREENFYSMVEDYLISMEEPIAQKEDGEAINYDMWDIYYQDIDTGLGKFDVSSSASRHRRRRRNMVAERANACNIAIAKLETARRNAIYSDRDLERFKYYEVIPKYSRDVELKTTIKWIEKEMEGLLSLIEEDAVMFEIAQNLQKDGVGVKGRLFYAQSTKKHEEKYAVLLPIKEVREVLKADRKALKQIKRTLKRIEKNKSRKKK